MDLPVVPPLEAKTEDKKLTLVQTARRLEHANGTGADWAAKTDFLIYRYIGVAPHASNEADISLEKFSDFGSDLFEYGRPTGLTTALADTALTVTRWSTLRYLRMEMRIYPKRCVPEHLSVPDMPDFKILEVLLRLPLNDREDALHPHVTTENVTDPIMIIRLMEAQELPITFGMIHSYTHLFDPDCFKKELFKEVSKAKFCLVRAILLRDYVGQGLVPDIENRLQGCRQVTYSNGGRMYIKPVAKFHRDFMRLVNELDTKGDIPFNLTSIEFHNLSQELKQELLNQGYSVPLNTNSIAEQYKNLSDLLANATEAERKIKQVSLLIRNTIGQQN
jgi:hypothetical protein